MVICRISIAEQSARLQLRRRREAADATQRSVFAGLELCMQRLDGLAGVVKMMGTARRPH